jgi:uncharacterized SAM-binding protein YcdF (DUF218 family)
MIRNLVRELFIPGSVSFLVLALIPGTLLLYRRSDGGRAGKIWITTLVLCYWALCTPITAVALIDAVAPDNPPVLTRADARGATAIVVLGAGMHAHKSRGEVFEAATREHALRVLEAARVYRLLDRPWVVVTGSLGPERVGESVYMAQALQALGVPADRIVQEPKAMNTHEHAMLVPPLLDERGVKRFVLVTSRQHMTRSLMVFRAVGLDPVPSSPEVFVGRNRPLDRYLPSMTALEASTVLIYDQLAMVYYRMRGWI